MKKVLAAIMSLIIVLAVGTSCHINKKAEDEYKAEVKELLDSIPVEATGYGLALRTEADGEWSEDALITSYCGGWGSSYSKQINSHVYNVNVYGGNDDEGVWKTGECYMEVSVDGREFKQVYFNYKEEYKNFRGAKLIACFDEKIFVIRGGPVRWREYYREFFPPTLFLYDYETNELKYLGYSKDWFDYRLPEITHNNVKIVKK